MVRDSHDAEHTFRDAARASRYCERLRSLQRETLTQMHDHLAQVLPGPREGVWRSASTDRRLLVDERIFMRRRRF